MNWFSNVVFLSGSNEGMFTGITMKLINESEDFKAWLKKYYQPFRLMIFILMKLRLNFRLAT